MKKIVLLAMMLSMFLTNLLPVKAMEPYATQTLLSQSSKELVGTQTAYIPVGILQTVLLEKPTDIFVSQEGTIYISDAGLRTIFVLDASGNLLFSFGDDVLENPMGLYVDASKQIYVADYQKEEILKFDERGDLIRSYTRPDSPLFGKTAKFKPQKIAVDKRGNMYVISEGSTNGIIQLANDGSFLGYYGVNKTASSFFDQLRSFFFKDGESGNFLMKTPPAPTNIAMDGQGLVYSITAGTQSEIIKKLNVAGVNMFAPDVSEDGDVKGISVDQGGNVFTINQKGEITVFDSYGNLLFLFGGKDDGTARLGLFQQPTAIAVAPDGKLYVSDIEKALITVFEPTDFGSKVLDGVALSKDGLYEQAQTYWLDVLRQNGNFGLAHSEMGKAYFKVNAYNESLAEFKDADDRAGYSDAFWEIRDFWLQNNLTTILSLVILWLLIYYVAKFIDRKKQFTKPIKEQLATMRHFKWVDDFQLLIHIMKHPVDTFYDIRKGNRGSVVVATMLYLILYVEFVFISVNTAYLFNFTDGKFNFVNTLTMLVLPLTLFIVMNYLVSTISDGSGSFKSVYIGTAYAFMPVLFISVPLTLVSHTLTFNEAFIYSFTMQIMVVWTAILLFIMVKEIQDYSIGETIKNIAITIFAMMVAILVFVVIYILLDQVFAFGYSIIQEVILRG